MSTVRGISPAFLLALTSGLAFGQAPDPAAERARLANERIQIEAERRAQEELARQQAATIPATPPGAQGFVTAQPPATPSLPPARPPESPRPVADMERTQRGLQQLRELGELKDAGHLTDAEFQRIKQRILESYF